jgi:preprotein translocase subunit SecA
MEEDVPIESKLITSRIASAQKSVEAQHFASRKHVLEYDDVMNKQRQAVYSMRRQLLDGHIQKQRITEIVRGIVGAYVDQFCSEGIRQDLYDLNGLQTAVLNQFGVQVDPEDLKGLTAGQLEEQINSLVEGRYDEKENMIGAENLRQAERIIMLNVLDNQWKDHLLSMDHLKEGIGLRGYGQKDPLIEYKKESFTMFQDMMDRIEDETIKFLFFMRIETGMPTVRVPHPELLEEEDEDDDGGARLEAQKRADEEASREAASKREAERSVLDLTRNIQRRKDREMADLQFSNGDGTAHQQPVSNHGPKVGRNDPCPCGSGKKYKKCHGAAA